MSLPISTQAGGKFRAGVGTVLLTILLASSALAGPAPVSLDDSIREVEVAPQTGPLDPHRAFLTRSTLKAAESAAVMDFEVALKMRNFSELQARVSKGEKIPYPEMVAKYQPLASDYQSVVSWLTGQGLQITHQDNNHLAVFVRGSVSQIQQALNVKFGRVQMESQEYTAAVSAPNVPGGLAPLLVGINGLQPYLHPHKHTLSRPNSLTGTNPPYLPSQIAQAYDASNLYNYNINGTGETIAIVIDTFPNNSDLTTYWSTCHINQSINNIDDIVVEPTQSYGAASGEETLDVEWSSSIAPGAKVRVYGTSSLNPSFLDDAYNQIYQDVTSNPALGIHEMSMSYGGGESRTTQSAVNTDEQYFAELASAGVSIFASSGDGGSTPGSGSAGDETGPLQVEQPADDPYVAGVGGTSLVLDSNGNESSETVWNNLNSNPNYGASGGGASGYKNSRGRVIVTFSRPSWQTGTGVPSGTTRLVPDLAGPADVNNGGLVILNGSQAQYGGTSWAAPTMAGFCALLNQAMANAGKSPLGLLGPQIYPLIGTANFRDITSGNNFTAKSPTQYAATTGYDETTGVGVPLIQTLAQTLSGSTTPSITTQPIAQVVTAGQSVTFSGAATGTATLVYQWLKDGTAISGATSSSYTIASPVGTDTGSYSLSVSNAFGSATSNSASLVVATSQPTAQTVTSGNSATFAIVVPSTGAPYSFQWLFNGSAISGATGSTYTIASVSSTDAGNYSVMVTDAYGVVTTNAVSLTVNAAPAVSSNSDTPTMPVWGLAMLAALLLFAAARSFPTGTVPR